MLVKTQRHTPAVWYDATVKRGPLWHPDVDTDPDGHAAPEEYSFRQHALAVAAHYNLGFEFYSHFTSPIRRYVAVHADVRYRSPRMPQPLCARAAMPMCFATGC